MRVVDVDLVKVDIVEVQTDARIFVKVAVCDDGVAVAIGEMNSMSAPSNRNAFKNRAHGLL